MAKFKVGDKINCIYDLPGTAAREVVGLSDTKYTLSYSGTGTCCDFPIDYIDKYFHIRRKYLFNEKV